MKCDRGGCRRTTAGYDLFDYCAVCGKNLCPEHMTLGCCGKIPAESGMGIDDASDRPPAGPSAISSLAGQEPDKEDDGAE